MADTSAMSSTASTASRRDAPQVVMRSSAADVLPGWMRGLFLATAVLNAGAAVAFLPPARDLRALTGFPDGEPIYLATVALFVTLFGVGYLMLALSGRAERTLILLSAAGKLAFVALVCGFWASGALPLRALATGLGDLPFGLAFAWWLWSTRAAAR